MTWAEDLSGVLQRYAGGGAAAGAQPAPDVHAHFDQVSQSAPPNVMADGLAAAFKSDRTPGFGQMLSTLFTNSNAEQKAGLLNHLLSSVGSGGLAQILAGTGLAGLAGGKPNITPEQAQQVSPQAVQQMATNAQQSNPSIVDTVSGFYAQHSTLVKTLGGTALAIALTKVAERQR